MFDGLYTSKSHRMNRSTPERARMAATVAPMPPQPTMRTVELRSLSCSRSEKMP